MQAITTRVSMVGFALALCVVIYTSFLPSPITLQEVVQLTVGGALNGGLYAVAAVGLAVIFGVMRIINVVHGHFIVLACYISYWTFLLVGIDPFMSIAITVPLLFLLGVVVERVTIEPVISLGVDQALLITFASALVLESLMRLFWTANIRGISTTYSGLSLQLWSISIPMVRLAVFMLALASVITLDLFLTKTYAGKSVRATAQDWAMAEGLGVDTKRVYQLAFGIGCAYAGLAGSLLAVNYAFDPASGFPYLSKAFAVVVLAGLGNVKALIAAGIILGLVEAFGGFILGSAVKDAFGYIIFVLVLMLKPSGLAGTTQT